MEVEQPLYANYIGMLTHSKGKARKFWRKKKKPSLILVDLIAILTFWVGYEDHVRFCLIGVKAEEAKVCNSEDASFNNTKQWDSCQDEQNRSVRRISVKRGFSTNSLFSWRNYRTMQTLTSSRKSLHCSIGIRFG
ncbi:uncharacterized protein LOC130796329 isoform X2 [Actinidia eriantha]|uniref:uncharacterized protein LOC130796329 isoform X2 n=1 Tax=Actinidia eriantha TaxID=165200 RepID=UPI00258B2D2A|nr:uncharacterized protein LOC130796329 isoform X2 [Actinidia eriantha]